MEPVTYTHSIRHFEPHTAVSPSLSVHALKDLIVASLEDDKAEDIAIIDLHGKSDMADYMIVASGRVNRHVSAIADHVLDVLKKAGIAGIIPEGTAQCDWIVVDAYDIVVHIFRPEIRDFYHLEKMWRAENI
jgi:ribosome-associated protein